MFKSFLLGGFAVVLCLMGWVVGVTLFTISPLLAVIGLVLFQIAGLYSGYVSRHTVRVVRPRGRRDE